MDRQKTIRRSIYLKTNCHFDKRITSLSFRQTNNITVISTERSEWRNLYKHVSPAVLDMTEVNI